MRGPELAIGLEPVVEGLQRSRADPIQPPLGLGPDFDHAGVFEHPEVLRHRGLAEVQTADQVADRPLSFPEQIEAFEGREGGPTEQGLRRTRPTGAGCSPRRPRRS